MFQILLNLVEICYILENLKKDIEGVIFLYTQNKETVHQVYVNINLCLWPLNHWWYMQVYYYWGRGSPHQVQSWWTWKWKMSESFNLFVCTCACAFFVCELERLRTGESSVHFSLFLLYSGCYFQHCRWMWCICYLHVHISGLL